MAKMEKDILGRVTHKKKRRVVSRTHKKELIEKGSFTEEKDFERLGFSSFKILKPVYEEYIEIVYNTGEVVKQPIKEAMK